MSMRKISLKRKKSMKMLMEEKQVSNLLKKKLETSLMLKAYPGHHQGPEAYLCWEKDMEHWFDSNQVHEEDKTAIAEDTLTEDAFRKWEQDAYWRLAYDEPEATWQEMKELLYEKYVKGAGDELLNQIRVYTNLEPRRLILAKRPNRKAKLKNAHNLKLHQGATEHTTAARASAVQGVPTPQAKTRELSTKPLRLNKDQEDVVSRLKQEEIIPEPDAQEGLKPATRNPLKLVDVSVQAHEEATMICLSSPKRCDTGISFSKGPMKQKKVILKRDDKAPPKEPSLLKHLSGKDGTTTSSILLQEEPPDQSPNRLAVPLDAPIKLPNQIPLRQEARNFFIY
ncbi:hypothetical protein YC2023_071402 [Brassica napus]